MIKRPRHDFVIISDWFYEICMVLNPGKCHFWTLAFNGPLQYFPFNNATIENLTEEKILGVVLDNNLNFESYLKNTSKQTDQKLNALSRITKSTTLSQWEKMFNSFIDSKFSYCSLTWMFTLEGCNKRNEMMLVKVKSPKVKFLKLSLISVCFESNFWGLHIFFHSG